MDPTFQAILFWIFAILGIAGGLGLVLNKNSVIAAICLILNFFSIAGLYLTLSAEFLAIIQVLVYAGAIMVLFLFVIMLLNLQDEHGVMHLTSKRIAAIAIGIAFVVEMVLVFKGFIGEGSVEGLFDYGKVEPVGEQLMTHYLFAFEIISVILIIALIGAMVVAHKHFYKK